MRRIYHRFERWEEFKAGMWRSVSKSESVDLLNKAVDLISNTAEFSCYMLMVISEWKLSCEHNLSSPSSNRVAWLGQAACCLATSATEDITRKAWGMITQEQRDLADAEAMKAIELWEYEYEEKKS